MVSDATLGAAQNLRSPVQGQFQSGGAAQDNRTGVQENFEEISEETRPSGTSAAQSQETETRNNGQQESPALQVADENSSSVQFTGSEERGSVVDITV